MRTDHLPHRRQDILPSAEPEALRNPSLTLQRAVESWLQDGKSQGWSKKTLHDRNWFFSRFIWWLENEERISPDLACLTPSLIRRFLTYVRDPHPTGRFGRNRVTSQREARPSTVNDYYRYLRAFTNWCREEGLLHHSPLKNVKAPRIPNDQLQPLSPKQCQALLDATRLTKEPERNRAIILTLLETGLRLSEACSLTVGDANQSTGEITVTGKGGKRRRVYLSSRTARRALRQYLDRCRPDAGDEEPLFVSERGGPSREALTPNALALTVRRLAQLAGLKGVACSPHYLRRTFAINFLRAGGNLFTLQQLMGHEGLEVLRRYCAVAEADLEAAHRQASVTDRMRLQ